MFHVIRLELGSFGQNTTEVTCLLGTPNWGKGGCCQYVLLPVMLTLIDPILRYQQEIASDSADKGLSATRPPYTSDGNHKSL